MNDQELKSFYTFHLNRKCLFCQKSIADQEHATLKYCRRKILPDGTVGCCKDDFHTAKNKRANLGFNSIVKHHKIMTKSIESLLKVKGEKVTIEDLNRAGINLMKPVQIMANNVGITTYCFVGYSIIELSNNIYNISKI